MKYLSKYGKRLSAFLLVTIMVVTSVLAASCRICLPLPPPPTEEAYITPTSGASGSTFTITDPQGRIESGDVCVFNLEGMPIDTGTLAYDVVISEDGMTLTGTVPHLDPGKYYVSVRIPNADARFPDLSFEVNG